MVSGELGIKLEDATLDLSGIARRIEMSKHETMTGGGGIGGMDMQPIARTGDRRGEDRTPFRSPFTRSLYRALPRPVAERGREIRSDKRPLAGHGGTVGTGAGDRRGQIEWGANRPERGRPAHGE